jgi:hypothetical protein
VWGVWVCGVCGVCGVCVGGVGCVGGVEVCALWGCGVTFDIPQTALVATLDTYDFYFKIYIFINKIFF